MAVMMISQLDGAGPELFEDLRERGIFDQMRSAPGFVGHWSGTTDKGVCVIELWESSDAHQAWLEGTIRPNLPPGVDPPLVYVQVLNENTPG